MTAFYDSVSPALPTGDYQVIVQDTVIVDGGQPSYYGTAQRFQVTGPRVALGPGDVVAMSPPAGSGGSYGAWLPHMLLAQRSLPWQVEMPPPPGAAAGGQVTGPVPWLALLLLTRDEIDVAGSPPQPGGTGAQTVPLGHYKAPPAGTLAPVWTDGLDALLQGQPDLSCAVVDVTYDAFRAVAPNWSELPYLAHVRQVDPAGQEVLQVPAPGWYSVVAGNRLPYGAADGVYIAHLVSLEGFSGALPDQPAQSGHGLVRLLSLASWTFTSGPDAADFAALTGKLSVAPLTVPVSVSGTDTGSQLVATAAAEGYTLLPYATRLGEPAAAWYRGPCRTGPVTANPQPAYPSAAAALIYDQDTGLFDASYAAAWEVGRLLTLANGPVTRALAGWTAAAASATRRLLAQSGGQAGPVSAAELAPGAGQRAARRLIAERLLPALLRLPAASPAGPATAPAAPAADTAPAAPAPAPRQGGRPMPPGVPRHQALRDLAADPAAQATVRAAAGPPPDAVSEWLAGLQTLAGVPFCYLVPDSRMLPPESIRFFAVDPNWTAALADGALSLAAKTAPAAAAVAALRPVALAAATAAPAYSGFLLRSAAVADWPGMRVAGYADAAGATELTLARLERVAPTVLLALFSGLIQRVVLTEPEQHLHLGVSSADNPQVSLRWIDPGRAGMPNNLEVPATLRGDPVRKVVDVDATRAAIQQELGQAVGPAALSLQFAQSTASQVFTPGAGS